MFHFPHTSIDTDKKGRTRAFVVSIGGQKRWLGPWREDIRDARCDQERPARHETPYDHLVIVPEVVAETVCARRKIGPEATAQFVSIAETRCRVAYDAGADWFIRIAKSRTNHGRNQLYVFVNHWLDAFLMGKPNERNEQ